MNQERLKKLENWLMNTGRDIEVARFNYIVGEEDPNDVLTALTLYLNDDGGFGNALEPDNTNPNSTPATTVYGLDILYQTKGIDQEYLDDVVSEVMDYLYKKAPRYKSFWPFTVESNNQSPCAVWWRHKENKGDLGITAYVIAYTLYYLNSNHRYYKEALRLLDEVKDKYLKSAEVDQYTLRGIRRLLEVLKERAVEYDVQEIERKYMNDLKVAISPKEMWNEKVNPFLPLDAIDKTFYLYDEAFDELIEENFKFFDEVSLANGAWDITWSWGNDYPEQSSSQIKWIGILLVDRLKHYKIYNKLKG